MADRGERGFDRTGGPNVRPVLGWKVIEGQHGLAVFTQFGHRFRILDAELTHEMVKGGVGLGLGSHRLQCGGQFTCSLHSRFLDLTDRQYCYDDSQSPNKVQK